MHIVGPGWVFCAPRHLGEHHGPANPAELCGQAREQGWPLSSAFCVDHSQVEPQKGLTFRQVCATLVIPEDIWESDAWVSGWGLKAILTWV